MTAIACSVAPAIANPVATVTWHEVGDAGQTLASVQQTSNPNGSSQPLTTIAGNLASGTDADLYMISIYDPAAFSATTVGTTGFGDTQLFLLTLTGQAIYLNDDADSGTFFSTLPGGSPLGPISAGLYILGVANGGYDPVNAFNELLFDIGLFTDVRGPAGNLQPTSLAGFTDNTFGFGAAGDYIITLTGAGASVPEPASLLLVAMAGVGCTLGSRRRKPAGTSPDALAA